ncbi:pfh1 [Symbiodinium microadriaticum]|nr:pfh1 [Symbiodinium microadriaticum]
MAGALEGFASIARAARALGRLEVVDDLQRLEHKGIAERQVAGTLLEGNAELGAAGRGGKFFPVSAEDGGPAVWQTPDWIRILWHPSAYNGEDARRLPLCLEPSEAATAELARFEKAIVAQLASRTLADPKIFGRMLTTQELGDLTNRECQLRAELKQVWLMSGQCGLLIEVTDLMLRDEEPLRCPF